MTIRTFPPRLARPVLFLFLATGVGGCNFYRNLGSGTHMYATQEHPKSNHQTRVMVVEVTTDAEGQIADIHFQRSSGKDGIDNYVAETIRQSWPQQPSTRTVAQVTYSDDGGFTPPKVLSSSPAASIPAPPR